MTDRVPAPPKGAREAGRRLWRAVLGEFELAEHETALLRQAVHVADVCEELQRIVDEQGPLKDGRAHPAAVELRQQRIILARLIVALRVPLGDEDAHRRLPYRPAVRGVYNIRGGAA